MRIGILTAMLQEVALLKKNIIKADTLKIGGRDFLSGQLFNEKFRTIVAFSGWGKVAAASTTATLIREFKVDHLIFTGVAASIKPNVKIGDIVVASNLYQHDMDARPIFPKYTIPLTGQKFFGSNPTLAQLSAVAANKYLEELMSRNEPETLSKLTKFKITSPKVHMGTIATGDKFIKSSAQVAEITSELNSGEVDDVLAVEMEGAAVAQVCQEHGVPFSVIRTISDYADMNAEINFLEFVENIASQYTHGIIKNIFKEDLKKPDNVSPYSSIT